MIVTNLPTTQEVGPIKARLKQLSDNCGGRVIYAGGGEARLRFSTPDAATRSVEIWKGTRVGEGRQSFISCC